MSLSDKRAGTHLHDYFLEDGEHGCNPEIMTYFYHEEDLKAAIAEFKKKYGNRRCNILGRTIIKDIDEIFGPKLTDGGKDE